MKRVRFIHFALLSILILAVGCRKEKIAPLSIGLQENYAVERLKALVLESGVEAPAYLWIVLSHKTDKGETPVDDTISREKSCVAVFSETGVYRMKFVLDDPDNHVVKYFNIHVDKELSEYSSLAVEVLRYRPAPGTYVNYSPPAPTGENFEANYFQMRQFCESFLRSEDSQEISLGTFGGSITLAFDHLVLNREKAYDFEIKRNIQNVEGRADMVVWVAYDSNKNGKPDDDEWYMLKTNRTVVNKAFTVSYATGDQTVMAGHDDEIRGFDRVQHVKWVAGSEQGYIPHLTAIANPNYMPITWLEDWDKAPYAGVLLEDRTVVEEKNEIVGGVEQINSANTTLDFLPYNDAPEGVEPNDFGMDIGWAVDAEGNSVKLPGIHFVRIVTGVHKQVPRYGGVGVSILCVKDLTLRPGE